MLPSFDCDQPLRWMQAAADAEQARAASEAALEEVSQKVKEAEDFLETEKSKPGQAFGALWWIGAFG